MRRPDDRKQVSRLTLTAAIFLALTSWAGADSTNSGIAAGASTYAIPGIEIGGFVSDDGGAGEINAILPLSRPSAHQLFFIGGDGKLFNGSFGNPGGSVYNLGGYLGYRERMGDGVFGLWAGADHLRTRYGHDFNRFAAGGEYYGPRLIARVNGFVPFDTTSDEFSTTSTVVSTTPSTITTPAATTTFQNVTTTTVATVFDERVSSGIDGEVGFRFAAPALRQGARAGEWRIFAGAYDYFGLRASGGDVPGARGRLELDLFPFEQEQDVRLSLVGSYSHDDVAGGQLEGGVRLSVPIGGSHSGAAGYSGLTNNNPATANPPDSGAQDLFQPVRRNREPVSVLRQKRQVATSVTQTNVAGTVKRGFTLASVCGGTGAPIPVSFPGFVAAGLPTSVTPGTVLGNFSNFGPNGPAVSLNLAVMTTGTGQTLAQLLAASPAAISAIVYVPIPPAFSFIKLSNGFAGPNGGGQFSAQMKLIVNGTSCKLEISVGT